MILQMKNAVLLAGGGGTPMQDISLNWECQRMLRNAIKVEAHAMIHSGSMQVWFLACEFLAGHSSFICHEVWQFEIFNLED